MLRAVLAIASIALTIFALADCIQSRDEQVRGIPKWAWIILIVLVPWIGPITWLLIGKDREAGAGGSYDSPYGAAGMRPGQSASGGPLRRGGRSGGSARSRRQGPLAPDEDPEFLRKLDEDIRRERRAKAAQEAADSADTADGATGASEDPATGEDLRPEVPGVGEHPRPEDPDAAPPSAPRG
ncbi:PLD nuclease N-terminal domain-containing protein [Brachybacterium sp. JHP9]|uniref:PLD nuclease N-terminal domain-containing protein n=1 Tax=Brachybacterium equifaecis TaxID=2910770 RepID=A0ABT0QYX5_9MICO|nr:PLDc N-terminal domain-containing protein [Brachybacterium equifaecis]MCL6422852.1 PLD nuclease N-terminal domain-containing protein [Brachybacterium equifaecis]